MDKRIFLIILFVGLPNWAHAQRYHAIYKEIRKKQINFMPMYYSNLEKEDSYKVEGDEDFISAYHIYRKRLDILRRLPVDVMNDTVYILEREGALLHYNKESTILTRDSLFSYYYYPSSFSRKANFRKDSLTIIQKPLFPIYMLKLAIKWDLEALKQEGEEHGMIPQDYIWLTRIIFKDRKYLIDFYMFGDFLKYERDFDDNVYYEINNMKTVLKRIFE